MFLNTDNFNEMERDDELYFKESDDELDFKNTITDYRYLLYGGMNEFNSEIFFFHFKQENVLNKNEVANSKEDARENDKEMPKDNKVDKLFYYYI